MEKMTAENYFQKVMLDNLHDVFEKRKKAFLLDAATTLYHAGYPDVEISEDSITLGKESVKLEYGDPLSGIFPKAAFRKFITQRPK